MLLGVPYDADGACARRGQLLAPLWERLLRIPYIEQSPPKSTGRELFSRAQLRELLQGLPVQTPAEDILHTLTRFTAWSVAENLRRHAPGCTYMLVSGGGALNGFLLECLCQELPQVCIERSEVVGIPVLAKEALCFAYLAYQALRGEPTNLPAVTGARAATVLGVVAHPEGRPWQGFLPAGEG
jgi:anhydro-N-acetylmuramic acid kinase